MTTRFATEDEAFDAGLELIIGKSELRLECRDFVKARSRKFVKNPYSQKGIAAVYEIRLLSESLDNFNVSELVRQISSDSKRRYCISLEIGESKDGYILWIFDLETGIGRRY